MISPTLACADYLNLKNQILDMDKAGCEFYHIDIMDGNYVPNICLNFEFINAVRSITETPFDVHLMVENPMDYIDRLAKADVQYISAHINKLQGNAGYFIDQVHRKSMKAGLVLSPEDSIDSIIPYIDKVDYILIMFVKPGFSGQQFMPSMLEKAKFLSDLRKEEDYKYLIEADGGIGWDNIELLTEAGVDISVAGVFAVFNQEEDLYKSCVKFRKLTNSAE